MEDLNELGDVVLQLHLRTNLARYAVIAKSPVGRTGDAALESLVMELLQLFNGVANDDLAFGFREISGVFSGCGRRESWLPVDTLRGSSDF